MKLLNSRLIPKIKEKFVKRSHVEKQKKIIFEEGNNYNIPENADVKVIKSGQSIKIKNSWRKSTNLNNYRKIGKNKTIDIRTGEIKQYDSSTGLKDSKSIKRSMKKLKELVNLNFSGEKNELFITLTCLEPVTKLSVIKKCVTQFIRRLKYKYPKCRFLYICKFEQDLIGGEYCWHCHILLKDLNHKTLFIPNPIICKLWKNGFTQTKRVYNKKGEDNIEFQEMTDDINYYPSDSYSSNIDSDNLESNDTDSDKAGSSASTSEVSGIAEYISKDTQLYKVKKGEVVYVTSNNVERPIVYNGTYKEIKGTELKNCHLIDERTILVRDESTNNIINKHKTETYHKN